MARRRNWRRLGENLTTPGTKTTQGTQVQADNEVQEAVDKEYNKDADAYNHSGVGYEGRGDSGGEKAVRTGLNQQTNGAQGAPITPNLDATQRNVESPNAKGGNCGPNTGGGGNNGPTPGGGTDNHVDNTADDGAFLPDRTLY